jgi:catechol 2,3-dioxygenase-like lactoylglutathione lyase family enzyme
MGRLDHVHIRVPNREEAAQWYAQHLGFERVEKFDFWAKGFEGGPLQISADNGQTTLALFEASDGHPMIPQQTGVAFSVDAELGGLLDRARRDVERELGDSVERNVEDVVGCAVGNANCEDDAAQVANTAAATASDTGSPAEQPGQGIWRNYDFTPGKRVIYASDWERARVG